MEQETRLTASEADKAVAEYLASIDVSYSVHNLGVRDDPWGDGKTRIVDAWACTFTRGKINERFDFFTGIGNRAPATSKQRVHASMGFPGLTLNDKKGLTSYGRRYLEKVESMRTPQAPTSATVLHSLLLDSLACGQSFESWAGDLGYDTDSRKAFDTYQACMRIGERIARIITPAQREHLDTLLQDY